MGGLHRARQQEPKHSDSTFLHRQEHRQYRADASLLDPLRLIAQHCLDVAGSDLVCVEDHALVASKFVSLERTAPNVCAERIACVASTVFAVHATAAALVTTYTFLAVRGRRCGNAPTTSRSHQCCVLLAVHPWEVRLPVRLERGEPAASPELRPPGHVLRGVRMIRQILPAVPRVSPWRTPVMVRSG